MSDTSTMLILALTAVVAAAPTPASNTSAFMKLASKGKLTFTAPRGFKEVPVEKNEVMRYDYALRNAAKSLEIRVAVRLPAPPSAASPGEQIIQASDENVFPSLVQTIMLNLSNGEAARPPGAFDPQAVRTEYNADSGFTSVVSAKAPGWNHFENCMLYALRKEGAAEVYVFILFDDFAAVETGVHRAFHIVKFN